MITAATEPDAKHGLAAFRKFFFGGLKSGADDHHIGGFSASGWTFAVTAYNASCEHNIPYLCITSRCCEVIFTGKKDRQEIIVSYVVGTRLKDKSLDGNSDADYESVAVSCVVRPSTAPIADVVYADGKSSVRALGNALRLDKTFTLNPKLVFTALLGQTLKVCKSLFGDRAVAAVERTVDKPIEKVLAELHKPVTIKRPGGFRIEVTPKVDTHWGWTYWFVKAFFVRDGVPYVMSLEIIGANVMFYGQHKAKYTWFFLGSRASDVREVLLPLAEVLELRLVHQRGDQSGEINYAIKPVSATAAAEVDPNALLAAAPEKFKSFGAYWSWMCSYFTDYDSGHQNYGRGFKYKNLRVRAVKNKAKKIHLAIESSPECVLIVDRPLLAGEDHGFAAKSADLELRFAGGWRKSVNVEVKCNTSPAELMRIVFKHLPDGVATAAAEPVSKGAHAKLARLHDSIKSKPLLAIPQEAGGRVHVTTNFAFETNKHIDVDFLDGDGYNRGRIIFFCAPKHGSDRVLCSFTQGGMRDEARDFSVSEHEHQLMHDNKSTLKFLVDKAKAMLFPKPPYRPTAAAEVEPATTVRMWQAITKKIGTGVDVTFSGDKYRIIAYDPGDVWSEISVRLRDARHVFFANLIEHKLIISAKGQDFILSFEKTQAMLKLGSKFLPALLHTALEKMKEKGVTAAAETVPLPKNAAERLSRTFQQLLDLIPAEGRRGSVRINGVAFSYLVQPRKRRGGSLEVEMRRESDDSPAGGFGVEAHGGSLLFSGASFSETVDVASHAAVTSVRGLFEGLVSMFPEVLPEFYPRLYGRRRTTGKLKITAAAEPVCVPLKCLDTPVDLRLTVEGFSVVVRRREERTGTHVRNTWVLDVSGDARSPSYVVYDGISENDNGRAYNVFREVNANKDVFVGGIDAVTVKSVRDLAQRVIILCVKNAKRLKGMRAAQAAAEYTPPSISGFLTGNDRFSARKGNMSIVTESDARTSVAVRVLGHSWNVTVSSGDKKRRYVVSFGKPLESDEHIYLVRLNEPRKYPEILARISISQVKSGKELFTRAAQACFNEAAAFWGTAQAAAEQETTSHLMDLVGKLSYPPKTFEFDHYRVTYLGQHENVRFRVHSTQDGRLRDLGLYSLCLDHSIGKPQVLKDDGKYMPWKLVRKLENQRRPEDLLKVALAVIIKHVKDNDEH